MKKLIQRGFGLFGYHLSKLTPKIQASPTPEVDRCLSVLRSLGFNARHAIDVGTNQGRWTRAVLRFFPDCSVTMIEPEERHRAAVADILSNKSKAKWLTAGAGDTIGKLTFGLSENPDDGSSTFFTPADAGEKNARKTVEVDVTTLNQVVAQSEFPFPQLVKIDAEGFDLKVLAGASDLIGKTEVFFIEVAVIANGWENTMVRTIQTMDQLGYVPFDVTDLNRGPTGRLLLSELAFVKRTSELLKAAGS